MTEPDPSWSPLREELARLGNDLREMLKLRWELARAELQADLAAAKRLAVVLAVAAAMALTALPLLAVSIADALWQGAGVPLFTSLAVLAVLLLGGGSLAAWLAWRRFRGRLVALEQTLEELREDAVWLREWTGRGEPAQPPPATEEGNAERRTAADNQGGGAAPT